MKNELKSKPILPEKKKLSPNDKTAIKKKLRELYNEEVWLDGTTDTLIFCSNKWFLDNYIVGILTKYKLFVQLSLFNDEQ